MISPPKRIMGINPTRRPWVALGLICFGMFSAFVTVFAIPPIIGTLAREFHIGYSKAGLFMTAFTLIPTVGSILIGFYSDRVGVRRCLLTGLIILSIAGYLSSLTGGFWEMLICRILIGIGATSIFVPSLGTVLYLLPPKLVNLSTGAFFGSLNLGLSAAMLTTPILAASLGWRTPLRIYAAVPVLVTILVLVLADHRFFRPAWSAEDHSRAVHSGTRSKLGLVLVATGNFFLFFQSFAMITWLPEYLKEARGYPPAQVGFISMLLGLVVIPGSIFAGWLADRTGAWAVAVSGATLCALGPLLLVLSQRASSLFVSWDIFFVSLGTSLLTIPLTSVLSQLVSEHHKGRAVGLILTTGYAGGVVSTFGGGSLLAVSGTYVWILLMCAGSMLLTLVLLGFLRVTYRQLEAVSAESHSAP